MRVEVEERSADPAAPDVVFGLGLCCIMLTIIFGWRVFFSGSIHWGRGADAKDSPPRVGSFA